MNVQKIEGVYKMSGAVYLSMLMIGFGSKALQNFRGLQLRHQVRMELRWGGVADAAHPSKNFPFLYFLK